MGVVCNVGGGLGLAVDPYLDRWCLFMGIISLITQTLVCPLDTTDQVGRVVRAWTGNCSFTIVRRGQWPARNFSQSEISRIIDSSLESICNAERRANS